MNNTHDQNDTFPDILEDIHDRLTGFQADVTIPFDRKTADEILMEREFGIYGNLPHEEVFNIGGHACVSLIGVFKQINAHQIPIGFTEQTDIPGDTHDRSNTNGSLAMEELLRYMKEQNPDNKPTKYGSFVLWLDGFVCSFVINKRRRTCGSLP